ncbi:ATP-dependent RNA helicase DHX30 isoform X2 [Nilaparvata lugens]|nr:ATP-dependent RNA helicase DHX30 isoform X2 [Nilaparvata lugens]XP_039277819.1 ATP-dependent RNA helicase DHX30 isoform X2 [Nilaparvata lugens]
MERLSRHIDLIKSSLNIDKNKIIVPTFRNIRKIGGIRSRRKDAAFQCSVSINVPSVISVKACGKGLTKELAKKSAIDVFIRTTSYYSSKSSTSNGRLAQSQRRTLAVQSHYSAVGVNVLRELRRQYSQNATETKVPEQQKTVASTGLQRRDSEESSVTKEEEDRTVHHDDSTFDQSYKDLLRVYPQPTSRLKNFFDVFEKNLGKKMCKTSSKLNKSRAWEYKYKVDWPEPAEFVGVSASKKEAARRGALQVLKWLKDLGKIDLKGNLFTVNRKEFLREENKKPLATIRLNEDFVDETEWLMQEYDQVFSGPIQEAISQWDSTEMPFNFDTGSQKRNFSESESVLERRNRDLLLSLENRKQSNSEKLKLPITEYGAQIVDLVRKNPVVVIKGEPGCGKSTQVPQLIFEDYTERMEATKCNIVVTQPRKISAISIAERIADERYEELGNVVGYQVRMGSVLPRFNDGYIILCTLGVMLRKLLSPDGMRGITHLIIDEAHERDLNTDILLLLSKRAIKNNPDLRIVIMSATINPELFQNYFNNAPSLLVPGFTHPVTSRFLDRAMQKELGLTAAKLKKGSDQQPDIDSRVIAKAVHWVAANRPPGAILVFLPGWDTISKVRDELEGHPRLAVLPVHSRLSHDDQRRIFQRPPAGRRKVVLATNIAETSITINDVVYVIDSGLLKEKRLNSRDGMSCLDNHWASKASVIQRKGRAGRVQPGECYHLYSQHKFDSLDEFPMPEVHRIRLEMVVLQSKTYSGHEEAEQFLRQLPEPPSVSVIREAVKTLQFMGALDMEENLTALGHRISVFTTHPLISKALVYSYFFKCVNPLITIGTIMSSERDLFPGMGVDKSLIRVGKARFSPSSDHLAMAWLFQQWSEYQTRDERRARSLMEEMLGNHNAFLFIQQLQLLVADHLRQCNITPKSSLLFNKRAECNEFAVNDELIKGVFLAGVGNLLIHKKYQIKKGMLKKSSSLVTMNGNTAMITSESVNHKRSDFPSPLTTYFQEMHSAQMRIAMIRETSIVSPLTVALFQPGILTTMKPIEENKNAAGDVMIQLRSKKNLNFSCDMRTAKAIMKLRRAMWDVMGYFVMECGNPRDPQLYRDVNIFHEKVLILLNKMLLEAGTNIDYDEDGNLRKVVTKKHN